MTDTDILEYHLADMTWQERRELEHAVDRVCKLRYIGRASAIETVHQLGAWLAANRCTRASYEAWKAERRRRGLG